MLPDGALLRAALTTPLVLLAPGYALVAAALHQSHRSGTERVALGLGLSLALAACGGLVLNVTPWGLTAGSWSVFLAGVTLGASLLAASLRTTDARLPRVHVAERSSPVRVLDVALLLAAALIGAGAVLLSSSPPPQQSNQAYAILWAVPDQQNATTIHLGVQNMEPSSEEYVLRVEQYQQTVQEYAIRLKPTQTWQADMQLSTATLGPGGDLQAVLFRADSPFAPFRQTVIRSSS